MEEFYFSVSLIFLLFFCISNEIHAHTSTSPKLDSKSQLQSWKAIYESFCNSSPGYCTVIDQKIESITTKDLINLLELPKFNRVHENLRQKYEIYFVVINSTSKNVDILDAYQQIDRFLTTRPWWFVRQYPIQFTHGILGNLTSTQIIMERVPKNLEKYSYHLLTANFPPSETACLERPLFIKTGVGSWGNDIEVNLDIFFNHFKEYIHALYVTNKGHPDDHCGYVEPLSCPKLINKHHCTFLPSTNCSFPSSLVDCDGDSCPNDGVFTAKTREYVSYKDPNPDKQHNPRLYLLDYDHIPTIESVQFRSQDLYSIRPNTVKRTYRQEIHSKEYFIIWMFAFIFKYNSRLGIKVQQMLREFYNMYHQSIAIGIQNHLHYHTNILHATYLSIPFGSGSSSGSGSGTSGSRYHHHTSHHNLSHLIIKSLSPIYHEPYNINDFCIATHIRMGDRHLYVDPKNPQSERVDMVAFCQEHTNYTDKGSNNEYRVKGKWVDNTTMTLGQWYDMGCDHFMPFGAITLQHVVNASLILAEEIRVNQTQKFVDNYPPLKEGQIINLLVMTDDYRWLYE
jgi:hypothetical protein